MATLTSVSITPSNPFILVTHTQQFIATAHFSDSADLDITLDSSTTWVSDTLSVATISNIGITKGLATALTISGFTTISATYGGQTGTSILRVGLTNYSRIYEKSVDDIKRTETILNAAHNPIAKLSTPNFSMFNGGVTLQNTTGTSGGVPIGWTIASGHPGDFAKSYIANEELQDGYWVQLNASGFATMNFSSNQRNLGVVTSISVDASGNQLTSGGYPILIQITGEAYVSTIDSTIVAGSFLWYDANGAVKAVPFSPTSPVPIIGYSLEDFSNSTYQNMIKMRIQICGG